jgi:hypothetical protein
MTAQEALRCTYRTLFTGGMNTGSFLEHLHAAIIPFPLPLMALHAGNRKAGKLLEQLFRVGRLLSL